MENPNEGNTVPELTFDETETTVDQIAREVAESLPAFQEHMDERRQENE
jgi:hypothetical protein